MYASGTAILVSVLMVLTSLAISGGFEDVAMWTISLLMGILIPAIVATTMLMFITRLVDRLDELNHLLRDASVTDALTELPNRRGFFDAIDQLAAGTGDTDHRYLVAMIDLDDFKALNDLEGHAFGDRALKHLADWLAETAGEGGVVGRLGGDEFAFVSPAITSIAPRQFFELDGVVFSASIGGSLVGVGDLSTALCEADSAMYREKRDARIRTDARRGRDPSIRPADDRWASPVPGDGSHP